MKVTLHFKTCATNSDLGSGKFSSWDEVREHFASFKNAGEVGDMYAAIWGVVVATYGDEISILQAHLFREEEHELEDRAMANKAMADMTSAKVETDPNSGAL